MKELIDIMIKQADWYSYREGIYNLSPNVPITNMASQIIHFLRQEKFVWGAIAEPFIFEYNIWKGKKLQQYHSSHFRSNCAAFIKSYDQNAQKWNKNYKDYISTLYLLDLNEQF